jgi:hypothetical protein
MDIIKEINKREGMLHNYLLVNHTKKHMVMIEDIEELWKFIFRLLKLGWEETDSVETMHELEDYTKLRYLAKNENYTHDFGDEVFT